MAAAIVQLCYSQTVLLIPFSRQSLLLIVFKEAGIATLNTIVINSILTKECESFGNVSVFGVRTFTLKTDRFQNVATVFEFMRFH